MESREMKFTQKQRKAMARLEKAIEACGNAGLHLYVANSNFHGFVSKVLDAYEDEGLGDRHDARIAYADDSLCVDGMPVDLDGGDW